MTKHIFLSCLIATNLYAAATSTKPADETLLGIRIPTELRTDPTWFAGIDGMEAEVLLEHQLLLQGRKGVKKYEIDLYGTPVTAAANARQKTYLETQTQPKFLDALSENDVPSFLQLQTRPLIYLAETHGDEIPDEKEYFESTTARRFYNDLSLKDQTSPLIRFSRDYTHCHKHRSWSWNNDYVPFEIIPTMSRKVEKQNQPNVLSPIVGFDTLGLAFMAACHLNNIFPYRIAQNPGKINGKTFSILGLAAHDLTSIKPESSTRHFAHIANILKTQMQNGYIPFEVADIYADILINKEQLQHRAFLDLLQHIIDTQDTKALAGFFLIVREFGVKFNYDALNLEMLYSSIIDRAKEKVSELMYTSEFDIDKKNGIPLTDKEIVDHIIDIIESHSSKEVIEQTKQSVYSYEIIRTKRYVTIKSIRTKVAELIKHYQRKFIFPLLTTQIEKAQNFENLLELAGIKYQTYTDTTDAPAYLESTVNSINELLDYLSGVANDFAATKGESYITALEDINKTFQSKLEALTAHDIVKERTRPYQSYSPIYQPATASIDPLPQTQS